MNALPLVSLPLLAATLLGCDSTPLFRGEPNFVWESTAQALAEPPIYNDRARGYYAPGRFEGEPTTVVVYWQGEQMLEGEGEVVVLNFAPGEIRGDGVGFRVSGLRTGPSFYSPSLAHGGRLVTSATLDRPERPRRVRYVGMVEPVDAPGVLQPGMPPSSSLAFDVPLHENPEEVRDVLGSLGARVSYDNLLSLMGARVPPTTLHLEDR